MTYPLEGFAGNPSEWITRSILKGVQDADHNRKQAIQKAWDAYHGDHPNSIRVKPSRSGHPQPDDNLKANYARLAVDRSVEFLTGKGHTVEHDTGAPGQAGQADEETPEEAYQQRFWRENGGTLTFQKFAQNGAVAGHAFWKLSEPDADGVPGLEILDPSNVDVVTNPDRHTEVWEYCIQWNSVAVDAGGQPRVVAKRERHQLVDHEAPATSPWRIVYEESVEGGEWRETGREEWPYPFSAVVECQNLSCSNEFWGSPDLSSDVIGLNYAINRAASNIQRLLRLHAHRHWWATGVASGDNFDLAADKLIKLANPDAKMGALEVIDDLSSSIEFWRELKQAFFETSSTPEVATGKLEATGQLSGFALSILYGPLIAKTEKKQGTYGACLVETTRRALVLGGFEATVLVHWAELLPSNPVEEVAVLTADQRFGVSNDTILTKRGYDPELEREKRQAELDEKMAEQQQLIARGLMPDPAAVPPRQPPPGQPKA